ncbi:Protein SUPPRESSOR OF npr1-1, CONSTITUTIVE 1 [Morella rubra]|uniref:Protein SUPPRESSOR OF npr1-1, CONSTITUTIVE 1 n=1 Tax=Morella rubra TaxID=262757 RepID=A0A6A1WS88_9ROSI|nr:Protein SUPPRESSOR OF npr1-1, CONSTITUTIVE 1 [Morella rubra]
MDFSGCGFLTKIPDLSSAVNLKELTLCNCGSLVEIHDSVGFLDKLVQLSLNGCSSLNSFPGSLKLRSLEWLDLQGCSSLQRFPEISSTMECLQYLFLADSGIVKFPSSIGNLTGLRHIFLGRSKNLVHLSYIIHLQHLERISLEDCSKLVELPKDQVKKFEASSNAELLSSSLLPPLTNSSICNDSPSSMAFPQLADLILNNCSLSNDIFSFITLHCPSMLKYLDISRTDITTLTEIVKPFVGLRIDRVEYSKQFEEIVQLTPNIIDVCATGCMSVESFPTVSKRFGFNISEFRRLKRIGLCASRTIKVDIGNPAANPLLHEVRKEDLIPRGLLFPGDKIPDWFSHHKETSIAEITGNVGPRYYIGISPGLMSSDHVWAEQFDVESFKLKEDSLRVRFNCNSNSLFLKSCGVHLERKHDWNVKDHPGILREDVDVHLDGIRLTKRRRDRVDGDLDFNSHPKKKKRS